MPLTWVTPKGSLGIITERIITEIPLQATSSSGDPVTYSLISGELPRGLRLIGNEIKGSPTEVRKFTTSRFVIRATTDTEVEDRTFSISVDGADIPEWITREGFLQVGQGQSFFVLDNSRVEFQLEARDSDVIAGDVLEYFLVPKGGELPPGLTLSRDGMISGFTDPIFSIVNSFSASAGYDLNPYDVIPLDFREAGTNGYDSFFYDDFTYDYFEPSRVPRRLSRVYNFVVAVSDGLHSVNRLFKIYVVTEEFLKADNNLVQVATNVFTADSASDRTPIWITESNLGRFRANNYVTIFLEVYNPPSLPGSITYIKELVNPDGSPSEFPKGLRLDTTTGQLAGSVPYQSKITKSYQFTISALYFPRSLADRQYTLKGLWESFRTYQVDDAVRFSTDLYICIKSHTNRLPSEGEFWIKATGSTNKTFLVDVFGEIESAIRWVSPENLGVLLPNRPSKLSVEAESLVPDKNVVYEFISGKLPPGLEFLSNGLIQGKVKQFADSQGLGLTRFFENVDGAVSFDEEFDGGATTFDRKFIFTVKARDNLGFAEIEKTFFFTVQADSEITFANLFIKAFQPKDKRLIWNSFITDVTIFNPRDLYRYGDPNFSTQPELKMLLFAGIESVEAAKYVQAMSRNHYRKRMLFGDLNISKAKDLDTQETIYEVIYVELVDEFEKNGVSISNTVNLSRKIESKVLISYDAIKVDSDIPFVSDSDHQRIFPNSIRNMRNRISSVGLREREYLPLWMRSIQDRAVYETGYVKALVLCYAKPGRGESILARIRASNFDFKQLDFVADRYLIDIVDGEIQDKYLAFPQRGEKLP